MWYGGGCDLTPFYVCEEDFAEFHAFWKATCDAHAPQVRAALGLAWGGGHGAAGEAAGMFCMPPLRRRLIQSVSRNRAAAVSGVQGLVRPILLHPLPQGKLC